MANSQAYENQVENGEEDKDDVEELNARSDHEGQEETVLGADTSDLLDAL